MSKLLVGVVAACMMFLTAPALAQVPELAPQPAAPAQTVGQQWEYKIVERTERITSMLGTDATWREDGAAVPALPSGWLNARGAQGWELFDIVILTHSVNAYVYDRTFIWYFKRPASN
jgi:hypothetical protein